MCIGVVFLYDFISKQRYDWILRQDDIIELIIYTFSIGK